MKKTLLVFSCVMAVAVLELGCSIHPVMQLDKSAKKDVDHHRETTNRRVVTKDLGQDCRLRRAEHLAIDGTVDSVFEQTFRSNEIVITYSWDRKSAKAARSYYHHGTELLVEGDDDGDGLWETMIFLDTNHMPVAVFEKRQDGSVVPSTSEKMSRLQKTYLYGNQFVKPVIDSIRSANPE